MATLLASKPPPLRILHTADWHLGHRLYESDRTDEHRAALAWLLDIIESEKIEVLVVAGDVFDVANPTNQARQLYYDFLGQLTKTRCQAAVIVGGNHDSPRMLDAPGDILRALNLHVVGAARTQVQDQLVKIAKGKEGQTDLIVAAVPYLRERDIRRGKFGETAEERLESLRKGIADHYREIAAAATDARTDPATPILATGHLFAGGATDDPEKNSYIYQADEHNIEGGQFPSVFDYVALGHVHRAQRVGGAEHIRYSGSLIPLTFVEGQRVRSVRIIDIGKAGAPVTSRQMDVPYFRQLLRLHGPLEEVKKELRNAAAAYLANQEAGLQPWAEVRVVTEERLPNLRQALLDEMAEVGPPDTPQPVVSLLRIGQELATAAPASAPTETRALDELKPEEVFATLLTREGTTDGRAGELLADFHNLRNWMNERQA